MIGQEQIGNKGVARDIPAVHIRYTSETRTGRIFLPVVNALITAGVVLLVTGFGSSQSLAAAYGTS